MRSDADRGNVTFVHRVSSDQKQPGNNRKRGLTRRTRSRARARASVFVHFGFASPCIGWLSDPRAPFYSPTFARSRGFFFLFFFSIFLVSPNERCMEQNSGRHRQSVWLLLFCPVLPLCSSTSLRSLFEMNLGYFFFSFLCRLQLFVSRTERRSVLIYLTSDFFPGYFQYDQILL